MTAKKAVRVGDAEFLENLKKQTNEKLVAVLTSAEGVTKLRAANEMNQRQGFSEVLRTDYSFISLLKKEKRLNAAAKAAARAINRQYRKDSEPVAVLLYVWRKLSASVASKRATVFNEALRRKLTPAKMLSFVNAQGGFELTARLARMIEAAKSDTLWVAIGRNEGAGKGRFIPIGIYSDVKHLKKIRKMLRAGEKPKHLTDDEAKQLKEVLSELK